MSGGRAWPALCAGLAALLAAPAPVAAQEVTGFDRFKLYTACSGVALRVEFLSDAVEYSSGSGVVSDLRKTVVETAFRSRLRAARIYHDPEADEANLDPATIDAEGWLYVDVLEVGPRIDVSVNFRKLLYDSHSGVSAYAPTWTTFATGTHGWDVLQAFIAQLADRFMDEYLWVNAAACP